jgi:hypothetical protein
MKNNGRLLLKNPRLSALYLLFIAIYILQAILPAPDKLMLAKYSVSVMQIKLLGLSVEIPYILIWIISLLGYLRLKTYAGLIQNSKDGVAFRVIARGLLLLSLWLPLSAVSSNIFSEIYRYHPSATASLVRVDAYFNLLILFLGFLFIYLGTNKLLPLIPRTRFQIPLPVILAFIAFSVLYTFLTLHDPARSMPTRSVPVATYYEPDWLIVTTVIIPRLISWFLGLHAAYAIHLYSQRIKGKLYQPSLKSLALGLSGLIASIILLRCLQSLSAELEELSLGLLLGLVYILLIIIAVGYVLIAKGAYKLQMIEET